MRLVGPSARLQVDRHGDIQCRRATTLLLKPHDRGHRLLLKPHDRGHRLLLKLGSSDGRWRATDTNTTGSRLRPHSAKRSGVWPTWDRLGPCSATLEVNLGRRRTPFVQVGVARDLVPRQTTFDRSGTAHIGTRYAASPNGTLRMPKGTMRCRLSSGADS